MLTRIAIHKGVKSSYNSCTLNAHRLCDISSSVNEPDAIGTPPNVKLHGVISAAHKHMNKLPELYVDECKTLNLRYL